MLNVIYCGIFALAGCCIFSFLNVVIYRLPRHIFWEQRRSFCPTCKRQLKSYDLIPVISYLFLGGRCRYCKSKISSRYLWVELGGAAAACLCLRHFGVWNGFWYEITWQAAVTFFLLALLTVVALIDFDTMEIPNLLVLACMLPAGISIFLFPEITFWERVIGFFVVSLPMFLLTAGIPGAFGGGDIKLMAVLGIYLGWRNCLAAFLAAIFLGGMYGIFVLLTKKKQAKDHFAFGPFLCMGSFIMIFWGNDLIAWYLGVLL